MRSEREMLDLILDTAKADERIRAVILSGSRANPAAPRDIFQDYDVLYLVRDVAPFVRNLDWIRRFGELMILQMPEDMQDPPPSDNGGFVYLMQFMDGNRIDLGIYPLAQRDKLSLESCSVLLLDKDGALDPCPPPSERDYLPDPPTPKAFADCCNEFWWVSPYVAKGLWRQQITYAKAMLDQVVRVELMKMLTWHIGVKTGFSANPGTHGKYFQKYLEPELWDLLLRTYADADPDHTWDALLVMGDLFRQVALPIAAQYGFEYPHEDDQRVSAHLRHVRCLPREAKDMY